MEGRILAVDLGEKNIGLALSDPSGLIASPKGIIKHISGTIDAAQIAQIASDNSVKKIIVGIPENEEETESRQKRHVMKFVTILQEQCTLPIITWDESLSTNRAQNIRREMQVTRKKRSGHLDDLAAAVILQSYLDSEDAKAK